MIVGHTRQGQAAVRAWAVGRQGLGRRRAAERELLDGVEHQLRLRGDARVHARRCVPVPHGGSSHVGSMAQIDVRCAVVVADVLVPGARADRPALDGPDPPLEIPVHRRRRRVGLPCVQPPVADRDDLVLSVQPEGGRFGRSHRSAEQVNASDVVAALGQHTLLDPPHAVQGRERRDLGGVDGGPERRPSGTLPGRMDPGSNPLGALHGRPQIDPRKQGDGHGDRARGGGCLEDQRCEAAGEAERGLVDPDPAHELVLALELLGHGRSHPGDVRVLVDVGQQFHAEVGRFRAGLPGDPLGELDEVVPLRVVGVGVDQRRLEQNRDHPPGVELVVVPHDGPRRVAVGLRGPGCRGRDERQLGDGDGGRQPAQGERASNPVLPSDTHPTPLLARSWGNRSRQR